MGNSSCQSCGVVTGAAKRENVVMERRGVDWGSAK